MPTRNDKTPRPIVADPWPLATLIPGDWRALSARDAVAALARYSAHEAAMGQTPSAGLVDYSRVRATRLSTTPHWLLLEADARFSNGDTGLLTWFYGPKRDVQPADWTATQMRLLPWPEDWSKARESQAREFMTTFINFISGDEGRFILVQTDNEVQALKRGAPHRAWGKDPVARQAQSFVLRKDGDVWRATGTVAYFGALFTASFSLDAEGNVEMTDDDVIGEIAMDSEELRGPFRVWKRDAAPGGRASEERNQAVAADSGDRD